MTKAPICAAYILSNPSRSIYVGATQDLERRILEHKTGHFEDAHTCKYGIDRLVWYQECVDWSGAHQLELKLKNMHRDGKVALVNEMNPKWIDLSYGLFGWSSSRFKRVAE
ncbi:MAG: GIY-YIG nuclease family protein [Thermomicrobiales bacterium]|nr:GIY-YIG nuclease family protein [Thermomicrobiales bacterium]MCO5228275.1 GIY-YIG nuclease family protein [Thermomicrobiales bacterium]